MAYYLNEEQALLICMFSRTPKAAAVRREVILVFTAGRRGDLVTQQANPGPVLPDFTNPAEAARAFVASHSLTWANDVSYINYDA